MTRILIRSMVCSGLLLCLYVASTIDAAGQSGYPRTFTDANGHSVTLAAKPTRIASVVLGWMKICLIWSTRRGSSR